MLPTTLLCIGLTTLDVVALPVPNASFEGVRLIKAVHLAPAGTAAGTALVAARLGVNTQLAGAVGDDPMGRFIRMELQHAGVDVTLLDTLSGAPTSSTLIPIDEAGNRKIFHAPGAGRLMRPSAALSAAANAARVVHYAAIGAPYMDGHAVGMLKAARAHGAFITCDLIAPGPQTSEELRRILPYIDVFMPSAIEAHFVTGETDLSSAARILRDWGAAAVVIKDGARGAVALDSAGKIDVVTATEAKCIVDTTSCGDSFCAAFIVATLRSLPWAEALTYAAAAASLVAQGPATLGLLESYEQVERLTHIARAASS